MGNLVFNRRVPGTPPFCRKFERCLFCDDDRLRSVLPQGNLRSSVFMWTKLFVQHEVLKLMWARIEAIRGVADAKILQRYVDKKNIVTSRNMEMFVTSTTYFVEEIDVARQTLFSDPLPG